MNDHRKFKSCYELSHWRNVDKGWVATDPEHADRVDVEIRLVTATYLRHTFTFKLPEERSKFEDLCHAFDHAFEWGRRDKAKEIRKVLGVT